MAVMVDIAICYLIAGLIISSGIAVLYPSNVKARVFGYQFKSQTGARLAMFLINLLMWPAVILFAKVE